MVTINTSLSGSRNPLGPCISLPQLKDISIPVSISRGPPLLTNLLGHIVPAQGCRLFTGLGELHSLDFEELSATSEYYANFIANIADFRVVQSISLSSTLGAGFNFRAADSPLVNWSYTQKNPPWTLAFSYDCGRMPLMLRWFSIPIIKALSSRTDFGSLTKLDLVLDNNLPPNCRVDLQRFLGALKSVKEVTSNFPTLQLFMDLQNSADFVFLPSTPDFTLYINQPFKFTKVEMAAFLDARVSGGIPVKVLILDVTWRNSRYRNDAQWEGIFEQYDGLCVKWKTPILNSDR